MYMKKAASFTLDAQNLLWLKGQAAASPKGTVSGVVDRIVTEARLSGRTHPGTVRSVVSTIDIPEEDSVLKSADAYVRTIFNRSLRRPALLKESRPKYRLQPRRRRG
jgi:hypothetical protein